MGRGSLGLARRCAMSADTGGRRLSLVQAHRYLTSFGVTIQGGSLHRWRRRGQVAPGVPVEIDADGRATVCLADLEQLAVERGWIGESSLDDRGGRP